MNKKTVLLHIGIILVIILGLTIGSQAARKKQSNTAAPKEQPKMGGTLVFALGKEPGNPNPFIQTTSTTQFVREASYESLLTCDYDGRIAPNLATSYKVSSMGTVFTLRLRKGVKFHDRKEMKSDDIVWSADHVRDPKNGAYGQKLMNEVKSVEKIDDYTVKFTLDNPSVVFLFHLSSIRLLPIVPANSLTPGQIKLEKNIYVPGTGPFILEQHQPGFDTVLKKFPAYWGTPAYLDGIIFRSITDGTNRFNALRTGDVQMADRISPLDAVRVKKGDVKGIKILEEPLGGYQHLVFNYQNPLLKKLEMRQALRYATDKQRLVDEAFFGAAVKTDMMMDPNGIWGKAANIPPHKRDLAKAKALLKAAGYNGQELLFPGRRSETQYLESYQRMLGEAGINVKVEVLEAGVARERVVEGKADIYTAGGTIYSDPALTMMNIYYTLKVEKGRYSNPKVDKLLDNLGSEFDEKKRLKIFRELSMIIHNDVADIPLFYEVRFVGMLDKVRGFGPPPGYSYGESGNYFKDTWFK